MSIMQDPREATMVGRRTDGTPVRRPLSPHLQVYNMLELTSALSISGRITGVIWGAGALFMVWWLMAVAAGPAAFDRVAWFASSFLGLVFLFGVTAAAWFHTFNGIRHLGWDSGHGFDLPTTYRTGRWVLIATAAATLLTWIIAIAAWAS